MAVGVISPLSNDCNEGGFVRTNAAFPTTVAGVSMIGAVRSGL